MKNYSYFIELRLGHVRWRVYRNIKSVSKAYPKKIHRVPHLSLYGPFMMRRGHSINEVYTIIRKLSLDFDTINYSIDGWDSRKTDSGRVLAYKIDVSPEFQTFWENLKRELNRICEPKNEFDKTIGFWSHITLAHKLTYSEYLDISKYIGRKLNSVEKIGSIFCKKKLSRSSKTSAVNPLYLETDALRLTILENTKIHREYDFFRKEWLGRNDALNSKLWSLSLKNYRLVKGYEINRPDNSGLEKKTFLIGDLHLGHKNIINYCSRPFLMSDVWEMNNILINNWNNCIKDNDNVLFLGDLCLGSYDEVKNYALKLNGNITFIKGNHDKYLYSAQNAKKINYNGREYLLLHYPKEAVDYNGWVIHGHTHNNNLKKYPFINVKEKTVNVSVEVTGYRPVGLDEIDRCIDSCIKRDENMILRI
ncbi:MAG: 2'-5' RNA ligase family protein [Methanomicrobium sp.]|nr:2'-5' RNA ligase family protein [Methanomicrobium sp.]